MSMRQYLDRHAEPEAALCHAIAGDWRHVLCIPAFAEAADFLDAVTQALPGPGTLVIVVVNAPDSASRENLAATRALAERLRADGDLRQALAEHVHLLRRRDGSSLLLVARCAPGRYLAHKDGVGLARKIACDMACSLIAAGRIATPWIHSTDADARLPADYFRATARLDATTTAAAVYPFRHERHPDARIHLAQQLYDASLDYYVAGLRWAGSPWGFHTVGSTLVVNARHYAQARGFPKRRAGEDFYLLNKLAKAGRIADLETAPLVLASRLSDRVPFGTGPALRKISGLADPLAQYLFYHPRCFSYLKAWHTLAHHLWEAGEDLLTATGMATRLAAHPELAAVDGAILACALDSLGTGKALQHALGHSTSRAVFDRHLGNWFDAFRTLKFIHFLRDHHVPSCNYHDMRAGCQFGLNPRDF